ncbi:hypothetical protein TeGR_g13869, partial [Tetraparma gracilis]
VSVKMKILHEGEVNRARYQPQNPFVVATRGPSEEVFVFDLSKHPSFPTEGKGFSPQHRLKGHTSEGYGLSWSPLTAGRLATCGDDKKVIVWDVAGAGVEVAPTAVFEGHQAEVQDVAWHCSDPHMLGSVSSDKSLLLWDARNPNGGKPAHARADAHNADVNAIAFNPRQ